MSTTYVAQEPMFLREVEDNPKPSVYRDLIENAKSSGGDYWWVSASGVHPVSDEAFKRLGSRMAAVGYAR